MKSFKLFSFIQFILCFLLTSPFVVSDAVSSTTEIQRTNLSKLQRNLRRRKKKTKTNKKKKSSKASKSSKSNKASLCYKQTQEDALMAFKEGINDDPNGIMTNWISDSYVCNGSATTWGGITCVDNQVTKLQLGMCC